MPSEIADPNGQGRKAARTPSKRATLSQTTSASAYPFGTCLACGPDHPLQIRELSRCGMRGEGYGAWCSSCRRVYALDDMALEPAA